MYRNKTYKILLITFFDTKQNNGDITDFVFWSPQTPSPDCPATLVNSHSLNNPIKHLYTEFY